MKNIFFDFNGCHIHGARNSSEYFTRYTKNPHSVIFFFVDDVSLLHDAESRP